MELKIIEETTFDEYLKTSKRNHFMQTSSWGNVNKTRNYNPLYLGFYDDNCLKGVALLLEKKVLSYKTYYCPRGPIIDWDDLILVDEVLRLLKDFSKKRNGLYLKFNPDIIIRKLDENAKPIYEDKDNLALIDHLKILGAKHRGFTKKFTESSAPRFTFRVDVDKDEEELLESFHLTTKKILKRHNPYELEIYKGNIKDLDDFYKTMSETCLRKKIYLEPYDYFKNFYLYLNKDNKSDIYIVKADINKIKKIYEIKFKELELSYKELDKLVDKKKEARKKSLDELKIKLEKEIKQINEIKEDKIILSSIITAKDKEKVWTIHGGNSDQLMFLNGNYELYYYILKDSHLEGYKTVDFFGSDGEVDKNSPIYGIFLFKLRFGGDFEEFIGEFDLISKPLAYFFIMKALIIRRKIISLK